MLAHWGYQPLVPHRDRGWVEPITEQPRPDRVAAAETPDRLDIMLPLPTTESVRIVSRAVRTSREPDELDLMLGEETNLRIDAATGRLLGEIG